MSQFWFLIFLIVIQNTQSCPQEKGQKWYLGKSVFHISSWFLVWILMYVFSEKSSDTIWGCLKSYWRELTSGNKYIYNTIYYILIVAVFYILCVCIYIMYVCVCVYTQFFPFHFSIRYFSTLHKLDPNLSIPQLKNITPNEWLCIKFRRTQWAGQKCVCPSISFIVTVVRVWLACSESQGSDPGSAWSRVGVNFMMRFG